MSPCERLPSCRPRSSPPILFRRAGARTVMPPGLAVAAITTTGYAGILVGPVGVGAAAKVIGLPAAFWGLAGLLALVPLFAGVVTRARSGAVTEAP